MAVYCGYPERCLLEGEKEAQTPPLPHAFFFRQANAGLRRVLWTFGEASLQRVFHEFTRAMAPDPQGRLRLLLLGSMRQDNLRLLQVLAHDLHALDFAGDISPKAWVACGHATVVDLPRPLLVLQEPDSVLHNYTTLAAPANAELPDMDWERFLGGFDLIGVALDAARIASGLSELIQAPYFDALRRRAERVFFLCGHGALFDDALEDLVLDVLPKTDEYWKRATSAEAHAPWFIFENYDCRYTHFLRFGLNLLEHDAAPAEMAEKWRAQGIPLYPPFEAEDILEAFEAIKKRGR